VSETIDGHIGEYLVRLAGGVVLLLAAPVFMLIVRRRAVLLAGATAILAFLAWTRTPGTGIAHSNLVLTREGTALSETRYLIPVFAICALTLALAAREGTRRARVAAGVVLVAAIVWNVVRLVQLPHGVLPPFLPVLAAAAGGAVVLLAAQAVAPPSWRLPRGAWAGALLTILAALIIAPAGSGWTERIANSSADPVGGVPVLRWYADDAELGDDESIAFASWAMVGPLAGDRFDHHLSLVPRNAACEKVQRTATQGWVVTTSPGYAHGFLGLAPFNANFCLNGTTPRFANAKMRVYAPPGARAKR